MATREEEGRARGPSEDRSEREASAEDRAEVGGAARRGLYGARPSASHDALARGEFRRLFSMSARERMVEALRLGAEIPAALESGAPRAPEGGPAA